MQNKDTHICFIFNPAANQNRSLQHISWLRREASFLWKNYEIVIAKSGESISNLAKSKSLLFDVIVACGGDGTISQIVNGIAKTNISLGVLPIGSGNDFVKSLNLNKSLPECLEIIHQNYSTGIDLVRYEGDQHGWCVNTVGIGLDGLANYYAKESNWTKGKMSYYYGATRALLKFKGCNMDIQLNESSINNTYMMTTICNGKWEGGSFLVAPYADLQDGIMDVLTIKKASVLMLLIYLLRFRWGPASWMKKLELFSTNKIEINTSKPVAVHRDGEHLGNNINHLKLTAEKNALKVLVPKNY